MIKDALLNMYVFSGLKGYTVCKNKNVNLIIFNVAGKWVKKISSNELTQNFKYVDNSYIIN